MIKSLVLYILYAGYFIQLLLNPKIFYYLNLIKKPTHANRNFSFFVKFASNAPQTHYILPWEQGS